MKKIIAMLCLVMAFPLSSSGQKIPATLENPANQELQKMYNKTCRSLKGSKILTYSGLGVTAIGGGLMFRASQGSGEGAGLAMVLGTYTALEGALITAGGILEGTSLRKRLGKICEHNDFLLQPGMTEEMWQYGRAEKRFEQSRTVMKASGITTVCLAVYTVAGVFGCMNSDSEFLYCSTETAMWLSFAGAAAFLTSWAVNASAKSTMTRLSPVSGVNIDSVSPFIAPSPFPGGSSVVGLSMAATF